MTNRSSLLPENPGGHLNVRDRRSAAVLASRWTLANASDQVAAARASLSAMPSETPGLIRYSVFQGLDEPTLFHLSQWLDQSARDEYVHSVSAGPRSAVDAEVPGIRRDWREMATPYRSFVRETIEARIRCLVVVRQPIVRPDAALARDWIDTVCRALESEAGSPEGLFAASFFVSLAGDVALNLAEWVSADAHRAALKPADFGRNGSIGDSLEWRAARSHSGITSEHEVGRYELVGTIQPGARLAR